MALFAELDHLLPLPNLLASFLRWIELVKTCKAKDDTMRQYRSNDSGKLILEVLRHAAGQGKDRVAREYLLSVVEMWKARAEQGENVEDNRFSGFKSGKYSSGAGAKAATTGAPAVALAKVKVIVQEERRLGGAVLAGKNPDVFLPKHLIYYPSTSTPANPSLVGATRTASSDTRFSPYSSSPSSSSSFRPPTGAHQHALPPKPTGYTNLYNPAPAPSSNTSRPSPCGEYDACCQPGHFATAPCPYLHKDVVVDGKDLKRKSPDSRGKSTWCRNGLGGRCGKFDRGEECGGVHGCPLYLSEDHSPPRLYHLDTNTRFLEVIARLRSDSTFGIDPLPPSSTSLTPPNRFKTVEEENVALEKAYDNIKEKKAFGPYSFEEIVGFFGSVQTSPIRLIPKTTLADALDSHPSIRSRLVFHLDYKFFVQVAAPFGLQSTPGEFGALVDLTIEILEAHFGGRVRALNHSDGLTIAILDPSLTEADVIAFIESLGWRLNKQKTEHASRSPTHIGCVWDVNPLVVTVKEEKRYKYAEKVKALIKKGTSEGDLKPYLRLLYRFRASTRFHNALRSLRQNEISNLRFWRILLLSGPISSSSADDPPPLQCYLACDASNSALGFYIKDESFPFPCVYAVPPLPDRRERFGANIANAEG
ncbi:hypothetical protein JCM8547_007402 [Rhodosporidiobolus lusitaniae]